MTISKQIIETKHWQEGGIFISFGYLGFLTLHSCAYSMHTNDVEQQ